MEPKDKNTYKTTEKLICIIIPVFNRKDTTLNCLEKLRGIDTGGFAVETIVIDDGSTDGTSDAIKVRHPNVHLLSGDGNLWWTGCINMGIRKALGGSCDYVLTLNDDIEFDPDFIKVLLHESSKHPGAIIGSMMIYKGETSTFYIAGAARKGFRKTIYPNYLDADKIKMLDCVETDCLPGRSLLIPTVILRKVGLFDEKRFPHGNADHEFTLRCNLRFNIPVLVAVKSLVYTELNTRVINVFVANSGKMEFLKSFFNTRYGQNFRNVINTAFMHKHPVAGSLDCLVTVIGLLKLIVLKLILPDKQIKLKFNQLNRNSVFSQKM